VNDAAYVGLIGLGSVKGVVDGQKMLLGQLIGPFDEQSLAAAGLEDRAG
jgi:hypothetical protein